MGRNWSILVAIVLFAAGSAHGVMIGYFPGLEELIDRADAIVVLRIDDHIDYQSNPTLYTTHLCLIYQTLKGDIPKDTRIPLRLMDTRTGSGTPFALYSTHLMFLTKKRSEDEPTEYRTIEFKGANIVLSPFGNEKMPEGDTVAAKIKSLVRKSIEYWDEQRAKELKFLRENILAQGSSPSDETGGDSGKKAGETSDRE